MKSVKPPESPEIVDWDRIYREGLPPWETGEPAEELIRVLGKHKELVQVGTAIELGCGTGADAVYLAKAGLDVTAIDISPIALERARARARLENAPVHFVLADVFDYAETAGKFGLVYDAGFYDFVRQRDLSRSLDVLWRLTEPGSFYLALAGNADEQLEDGPPGVTAREINLELGRLLEVVDLRPCRLESPRRTKGYLGWSCLMRRPKPLAN